MKKHLSAWLVLAIIMIVSAFALGGTNLLTKDIIVNQEKMAEEAARKSVMPGANVFEPVPEDAKGSLDSLFLAKADDVQLGYVGTTVVKGFGGDIKVIVGISDDGKLSGVDIGGASFQETAGLGAKAKEPAFVKQFVGKTAPLKAIKAGEEKTETTVDAITAATITSNAVVRAVNDVEKTIKKMHKDTAAISMFKPGSSTAEADGFKGPVFVKVSFDANKTITAIEIGDERFAETPGLGTRVQEDEFKNQFIGKTAPLKQGDIDTLSGATITSEAVIEAVNEAFHSLSSAAPFSGGEGTAAVDGFKGPVFVKVSFDANKTITAIEIGDERFAETPGLGTRVQEDEFKNQFIGKTAPLKQGDIDTLSGATITSEAVIEAVNEAFHSLSPAASFSGGEGTAAVDGFKGPVFVKVSFDANKTITAIEIGDERFAETPGLGTRVQEDEFKNQFIGKTAPLKQGDIDTLSGATITSEAVIEAVNEALNNVQPSGSSTFTGGEGSATVEGFKSPVFVKVVFAADRKITEIQIGDDRFSETPGIGTRVQDDEFKSQFIGKLAPLNPGDVDMIAGATVTSTAVVEAINEAFESIK